MDEERKNRIKNAIKSFTQKNQPRLNIPRRTNEKPEKEFEQVALAWLRANGFHVNVVESKATFNPQLGRYVNQSVKGGFADIVGNHQSGLAVFIELKAPGRRSTLRDNQREFLLSKIQTGCFAVCVDSLMLLQNQFERFMLHHRRGQYQLAKDFLIAALPIKKEIADDNPLFPENE